VGDGARAATTEVFEGATVVETILEVISELGSLLLGLTA
jgi:hypothetical protein